MGANKCTCGTWNNDSAKYCRNCGKKLSQQNPGTGSTIQNSYKQPNTSQNNYTPTSESSNSEMGTGVKLFLTVLCIAVFIGISVVTGGIGTISAVVMYPALKHIWD